MATGLGIHIGLNHVDPAHYEGWDGELAACELDAQDMRALAASKGISGRLLLSSEATADTVTQAIAEAADQLESGDLLFLTYSGHGGQLTDRGEDEETDFMDETWVLFDRQLIDDELYALWGRFKPGVRIFMLSDSCHSGSVNREARDEYAKIRQEVGAKTRELPRGVQAKTYRAHKEEYDAIKAAHPDGDAVDVKSHVLLISGCKDDQLSLDGVDNGLFTGTLREVWADGAFQGDYTALHAAILTHMPDTQTPQISSVGARSPEFEAQQPLTV